MNRKSMLARDVRQGMKSGPEAARQNDAFRRCHPYSIPCRYRCRQAEPRRSPR